MEGALRMLLEALLQSQRKVLEKVDFSKGEDPAPTYAKVTGNPAATATSIVRGGSGQTYFRHRFTPEATRRARDLIYSASHPGGAWAGSPLSGVDAIHRDPSVQKALLKLTMSGKPGDMARAKLIELAAKQGLLPNLLLHGTNEHAITGIAKTKKTIPQKSWEDAPSMARPVPRTYWTPQPDVAGGMAAETSKVGNIREELRHQALASKPGLGPNLDKLVDKFIGPDHKALSTGILLSQEYLPNLPYGHPVHVGRGIGHILSEAKKAGLKDVLMEERFQEWKSLMTEAGIDINTPPQTWEIPTERSTARVGDAGRPAVITTKLSKIAKRLSPEDLRSLIRRMALGDSARDIVQNTYEITSRAVPASALRATVTKPPNPALGESMRGSMLRGKSKTLPLLELAKLLMKGMR